MLLFENSIEDSPNKYYLLKHLIKNEILHSIYRVRSTEHNALMSRLCGFSKFIVNKESPGDSLITRDCYCISWIWIQHAWKRAYKFPFATSSQVMLTVVVT